MYELNKYGKIVVDSKEIYWGCVIEINEKSGLAKLYVVDWRDKEQQPLTYNQMVVPISKFTIKYLEVEQ